MSENRNRGRIVYRIVSIFKEKVAKSRLKKTISNPKQPLYPMKEEGRIFMDLGRDRSAACIPSTRPLSTSDRNGLRVIGWYRVGSIHQGSKFWAMSKRDNAVVK